MFHISRLVLGHADLSIPVFHSGTDKSSCLSPSIWQLIWHDGLSATSINSAATNHLWVLEFHNFSYLMLCNEVSGNRSYILNTAHVSYFLDPFLGMMACHSWVPTRERQINMLEPEISHFNYYVGILTCRPKFHLGSDQCICLRLSLILCLSSFI